MPKIATMTRRRILFIAVPALFGAIAAVALILVPLLLAPPNQQSHIQRDLVDAASHAGVGGTVDMATVVPVAWDTVYIWDGYTADRKHEVFPSVDFGNGSFGSDYVVAFADHGTLAAWVRFNVDDPHVFFDPPGEGLKLARQDAKFVVSEHPRLPGWFLLTPLR